MVNAQAGTTLLDSGQQSGAPMNRDITDQALLARFLAQRDETAFAALVQRYGGAVWGVCRRMLHQEQDVEDAFQAVFLVLARKAAAIRQGEAVGSFLYGVAYRIAMKARQTIARREQREKHAAAGRPEQEPWSEAACRELHRLLDDEVQRLPEKYRAPFILCCLEGLSKPEAAQELGWKPGTVSGRLARARKLLQQRLLRRGVTLSAALTTVALVGNTASAAPASLLQATAQAVLPPQVGQAPGSTLSSTAVALAESLIRTTALKRFTATLALLLTLTLLGAGASLAAYHLSQSPGKGLTVEATSVRIAPAPIPRGPGLPAPPPEKQVVTLAFSPDGQKLVTAGARADQPGHLKICDVTTAREIVTLTDIPGTCAVAFSPAGQILATGEFSGDIKLRDAGTGQERTVLPAHTAAVQSLAFSPDGETLVSAGLDGIVKVWDVEGRQERCAFLGHTAGVVSVAYFHQAPAIVTGSRDQTAIIWDVARSQERFRLQGHKGGVEAVAVSPDDTIVVTAGRDRTIRLWDAGTGKELAILEEKEGPVNAVAFSPDGKFLASAANRTIRFWNVATRQRVGSLEKQSAVISTLAFSPRGNYLANGSTLGLVLLLLQFNDGPGGVSPPQKKLLQEFEQSFKGGTTCPPDWELVGPEAEKYVHFEPTGLRIALPAGQQVPVEGIGVKAPLVVQGDFEITLNFEILRAPQLEMARTRTRITLEVLLDRPNSHRNMASLGRKVSPYGNQFGAWQVLEAANGKEQTLQHGILTEAKSGRLRLVRTGALLSYYVSEGPHEEFLLLKQFPFGTEELSTVRIVGGTGGPDAYLNARITDFRVRSQSLPGTDSEGSHPFRWRSWLVGAILGLGLLFSLGLWLLRRRSPLAEPEQAADPVQNEPAGAEPAAASVSFPCSECGKNLKARPELAGKKVKCPQCGEPVLVPHRKA